MNNELKKEDVKYPYLPEGRTILYVGLDNEFMLEAKKLCADKGCAKQATGAVIEKHGEIIGRGTNAGILMPECARWGSPTGQNYGPCKDVCHQEGHAEEMAIRDMMANAVDYKGANIYLYGHWWCCQNCWKHIIDGGIANVYLLDNSWNLFNPEINLEMKDWGKPKN